jgi:ureidoglycolate hydrolase
VAQIRIIKVPCEYLTPEAFAPYGDVIKTFEEAEPEIIKGSFRDKKIPIDEVTLQQTHFAYHTDAGQSFYPKMNTRCIFMVGPIVETLVHDQVRAFYSDGSLGIVVRIGVWHTIPITLDGGEVFLSARGDSDYMEHSVEVDFDIAQGVAFEADPSTL